MIQEMDFLTIGQVKHSAESSSPKKRHKEQKTAKNKQKV